MGCYLDYNNWTIKKYPADKCFQSWKRERPNNRGKL